jgi:hypothetical protein
VGHADEEGGVDAAGERDERRRKLAEERPESLDLGFDDRQMPSA